MKKNKICPKWKEWYNRYIMNGNIDVNIMWILIILTINIVIFKLLYIAFWNKDNPTYIQYYL